MSLRVLILGATGFIGRPLVLRLRRDGHSVAAWARDIASARRALGGDADIVSATGGDSALAGEVDSADAVVNLAGAPMLGGRWSRRRKQELRDSRVGVTQRLVGAIERAGRKPRVLVSASAVGYYGDRGDEALAESTSPGSDFTADLCRDWENAALRARGSGTRVVLARIGVVLGRGGAMDKMLALFRARLGGRIGDGRQFVPWIHIDDVVEVITRALTDGGMSGPVNLVGPQPIRQREFARALGRALAAPSVIPTPAWSVKIALGARANLVLASQRALPGRLVDMGYRFQFPSAASAIADIVADDDVQISRATAHPPSPYLDRRPPRHLLRQEMVVGAPLKDVFGFFSNPENLALLTPRDLDFQIDARAPGAMAEGTQIHYRIKLGPVPLRWLTNIEVWQAGERFVDCQIGGPYSSWWHEHSFTATEAGTLVSDRVYYTVALGPLGQLLHRLFVAPELRRIFAYRRAAALLRFGLPNASNRRTA